MLLTALGKCLPGLVLKVNISLFTTCESKKSSGPNEALAELQGVRLAYAEEPSAGMVLDGGFLKDLCGGVEISTSKKNLHQIRFETTFHVFLVSNNEGALTIEPNEPGVRFKRVGWRMMNRFADAGDPAIDDATVFAAERGVRDLIGERYWISMLRILHQLYHDVMQGDSTPRFDLQVSEFALDFPSPPVARSMDYYVNLFEVYYPARGEEGLGMRAIHSELVGSHGLQLSEDAFYNSSFKHLMIQKIKAYRAQHNIGDAQQGGPRYKRGSQGPYKFYGIRFVADYNSEGL
jgi:hypothetical protein